jgi:DNA primase
VGANMNNILENIIIDVNELLDTIQYEYQHTDNYISNSNAFSFLRDSNEWVMFCCPSHSEHRPSCGVTKQAPFRVNCFKCGYLGTIDEVIENALDLDKGEGLELILNNFIISNKRDSTEIEELISRIDDKKEKINIPNLSEDFLNQFADNRSLDYKLGISYMNKRGFTNHCLNVYGITYDICTNCVVFPQRTREGNLRFVQKRRIKGKGSRFINEGQAIKTDILFGLHLIDRFKNTKERIKRVRLVESPTDVLANYEVGVPSVALNGKILFKQQIKELHLAGVTHLELMLDNDEGGKDGTKKAIPLLKDFRLYLVDYGKTMSKDSNDLLLSGDLQKIKINQIWG